MRFVLPGIQFPEQHGSASVAVQNLDGGLQCRKMTFPCFNQITSDEQNFQIHILFCSVLKGGVGMFCFSR